MKSITNKIIDLTIRFAVVIVCGVLGLLLATSTKAFGIQKLVQHINISNGEFSTTSATASPTDNSLGLVHYDSSEYTSAVVYFEAVVRCDGCDTGNEQVSVSLYNDAGVSQSTLTSTSSTYTRLRSGSLALSADDYTVRFFRDSNSGTAYLKSARLVIVQNDGTHITDTQTQIEVGHNESTSNTSQTELSAPKYYQFDADAFTGTTNAYFEATLNTNGNSTNDTFYFNAYNNGEEWDTTPANMVTGNTTDYASTSVDSDVQLLNGNTNAGTDLGTITAVEFRLYTYQTNGSDGTVDIRPVFGGSSDGDNHTITPPESSDNAAWSAYQDITEDTNAPSTWTWGDVQSLDADIIFNEGADGSNTAFVAMVEIRVTYEDNTIDAFAQLYNRSDGAVVGNSIISTSNTDPTRVRSSALSTDWDTSNDDEYEVRIYTSDGSNAADIANAKIIIDQSDASGIDEVQVAHLMISTDRTQTNTVYTQDSFTIEYDSNTYDGGVNEIDAYLEATMKTTASTGFAMLYNVSQSDQINNPTNSEITTTSSNYTRVRSSNLADNSDWPTASRNLDTIVKASSGETTTISNSWLIIHTKRLPAEATFRIYGVADSVTNNGVTTTVTSTYSTIPFGNLAVETPSYAAHQLEVTTNDASTGYTVQMRLANQMQGYYPANNFDQFNGAAAVWTAPVPWYTPSGTTPNVDTGWIGANITDSDVSGWTGDTSGDFGPLSTSFVDVMTSDSGAVTTDTEYVNYGVEVNVYQPSDTYSSTIQYLFLPEY